MATVIPIAAPLVAFALFAASVGAQSACSTTLTPASSIQLSVASGYQAQVIATGLSKPRSLQFDKSGNLLVVEAGSGSISALTLQDNGGTCVSVRSSKKVVDNKNLNHGLALSQDGATLFASSSEFAWSWDYDPLEGFATNQKTLVSGMNTDDHTTRTLLIPQKVNDTILISRGSTSNIDLDAANISTGHSQIKAFSLTNLPSGGRDFDTDGHRLGWGLRNSVGVVEHPDTGGIYSVENSADQISRDKNDVHEDNPGEELNFHGYLNGTSYPPQGQNYGYPYCFTAWAPTELPDNDDIQVGTQFAIDVSDGDPGRNDSFCREQISPRLTFQAHMAPLDIKFNNSGTDAWISFHGSWDRTNPSGYKLSVVEFTNGEPLAPAKSNTAGKDIFANRDNTRCPEHCFRPVGIAFDRAGRLFMSSDATGEVYVVVRDGAAPGNGSSSSDASGTSSASSTVSATSSSRPSPASAGNRNVPFPSIGKYSCIISIVFLMLAY